MIDAAAWVAVTIPLLGAACRLLLGRDGRPDPGRRYLIAFAVCMSLSEAVVAPAASSAARGWGPFGAALPQVDDELKLVALCLLALVAYSVGPPEPAAARMRWQVVGTGLVMLASAATFLASDATLRVGILSVPVRERAVLAVHDALFMLHTAWCLGVFVLLIHRSAQHVAPGLLRAGLRLVVAGGAVGLVWTALSICPLLDVLTTGHEGTAEDSVSSVASVLCLALGIGGATLTAWGSLVSRTARWLRAWRGYRRIGPLWSALHAAHPEISLISPPYGRAHRLPRDAEFALYRRIIEINDGHLALRAHFHPEVPQWAAAAADRGGTPSTAQLAATVEAATVAAALEAAAAGDHYPDAPHPGYVPREVQADIEAETAWLIQVSDAFVHSPAVESVRQRIRAELARTRRLEAG